MGGLAAGAVASATEFAVDSLEQSGERATKSVHGSENGDRDAGGDQAVLDGR